MGDSFYEYLLKVWLQGGKKETTYRRMFDESMDGVINKLLKKSKPSGMLYVAELSGGHVVDKMDHLACFLPAVLALGAKTLPTEDQERYDMYMAAAQSLTHTCYQMYHRLPTHLAPETVRFVDGQDMVPQTNWYILRPETAEALFYLHQLTGHPIYREWAWEIFQGIEHHCRTKEAYGAHPDVTSTQRTPDDRMESFFLAETMKYLYLIQDPDQPIDLFKYVFNTEAHPMRVWGADDERPIKPMEPPAPKSPQAEEQMGAAEERAVAGARRRNHRRQRA
jgi:mannosyl-oligosaccharide alpha-1,2-mannosidase